MLTRSGILVWLAFAALVCIAPAAPGPALPGRWWSDAIEQVLAGAGTNRSELQAALHQVPADQRPGLTFLLEHMPERDARSLSAGFLQEHLALAYEARAQAPWRAQLSDDLFLNDILPYACVNERREAWRRVLREKCLPLIADCRTPGEAAQRLNQKLFALTKVRYSTQRKRPDQGPLETMESGLATCTGLSILLVDACRSVGVPARIAGTPLWANKRGNHTWVEVWDGDWHFTGAAEYDAKGLNRGWFLHDASQALRDVREHAIYASSFRRTGLSFPLVWARDLQEVSAVNVTERYTPKSAPADPTRARLLVKVLDRPAGQRVVARVVVTESTNAAARFEGSSRGETADLNDILPFEVPRDRGYRVEVTHDGRSVFQEVRVGTNAQQLVLVTLDTVPLAWAPSQVCSLGPVAAAGPTVAEARWARSLAGYFNAPAAGQARWKFPAALEKALVADEPRVRRLAWDAFRSAARQADSLADYRTNQVRFGPHLSPYTVKTVGERPAHGWGLVIAMHGGGGTTREVNDSQWRIMQRYYRDHPEAGGYRYVALRAPNDRWNGFYDGYVYPLIENLIRQFAVHGDVDPSRVYLMGYSHGGYGAFAIGPKMPDRFAAIHASAAAPTDGETTARTLRNTVFTFMIGEKDTMYGRADRCRRFNESVQQLRGDRADIYPVTMQFMPGSGHGGLPDRDKLKEMLPAARRAAPRELTWQMTDGVIREFYWLRVPEAGKGRLIEATCRDNRVVINASTNVPAVSVCLDGRLVDFGRPVEFVWNGTSRKLTLQPGVRALCESMQRRGDPELAFTACVDLPLPEGTAPVSSPKSTRRVARSPKGS